MNVIMTIAFGQTHNRWRLINTNIQNVLLIFPLGGSAPAPSKAEGSAIVGIVIGIKINHPIGGRCTNQARVNSCNAARQHQNIRDNKHGDSSDKHREEA